LAKREVPTPREGGRSSVIAGGSIAAIELPTAFPYFAAIAAVVAADLSTGRELILIALYNVCFVLPLLGILATLAIAGDDAERILASGRRLLERNWPLVLAVLAALAGAFVMFLGITGLVGTRRGGVGRFARRLRSLAHP
jgi:cytochrome c biogenesis protein CcdA